MIGRSRARSRTRGVALINALVIMIALAGISTVLLVRAQTAIDRLEGQQRADQTVLYLDAAEALVRQLVGTTEAPHHRGQAWAQARSDEEIDRGHAGWRVDDLQGRFNLNWLMQQEEGDDESWDAAASLARLLSALDLPAAVADRLSDAAGPDQRRRAAAFAGSGINPPPQPLTLTRQLHGLSGIDQALWRELAPYLAALPADSALNVNTARLSVLGAALPLLDQSALDAIETRRARQPFESGDDFITWVDAALGIALAPDIDDDDDIPEDGQPSPIPPLTGGSAWFEAALTARLDSVVLQRTVVVQRVGLGEAARVHLIWHGSD